VQHKYLCILSLAEIRFVHCVRGHCFKPIADYAELHEKSGINERKRHSIMKKLLYVTVEAKIKYLLSAFAIRIYFCIVCNELNGIAK
jgi:hypothetical protein